MTITKARKVLGDLAVTISDNEIQEIIACFNQIIEVGFQLFETKYPKNTFDKTKTIET